MARNRTPKPRREWNPSLHPRDHRGRFTKSAAGYLSAPDAARTRERVAAFRPEQRDRAWLGTLTTPEASAGVSAYREGRWRDVNDHLRTGTGDMPAEVHDLDQAMRPLPADTILTRDVPEALFGNVDLSGLTGARLRDAAPASTRINTTEPPAPGMVRMTIAAPAGTLAVVDPDTGEVLLDRDTNLAITSAGRDPDGRAHMSAIVLDSHGSSARSGDLPADLTGMDDDALMDAVATLPEGGFEADLMRVVEELDRRDRVNAEQHEPPRYSLMSDPETWTDDELDVEFARASELGDELALAAMFEEYDRREQVAADRAYEASTPPAAPAYVEDPSRAWLDLFGSPLGPAYDSSTPETRERARRAIRLAYKLDPDASDDEFQKAAQAAYNANSGAGGYYSQRNMMYLAWYRKLALAEGVDPSDRQRFGPPDNVAGLALWNKAEEDKAAHARRAERQAAAAAGRDARNEAMLAAGVAGPARVRDPARVVRDMERSAGSDVVLDARRRTLGLPDTATEADVRAAERSDLRSFQELAATNVAWLRLLADTVYEDRRGLDVPDDDGSDLVPSIVPANVASPSKWRDKIKAQAIADQRASNYATAGRYQLAQRRAMGLPDDASDWEVSGAEKYDKRYTKAQRDALFVAWYRRLAADAFVDPTDELRAGPPDRKRNTPKHWAPSNEDQSRSIDALLAKGLDFEEAYAEVHNLDADSLKRARAAGTVDRAAGESTDAAVKRQYDERVHLQYLQAEQEIRGHALTPAARSAGIDPVDLLSGDVRRFRKYASEDLQRWVADNGGRMTFIQFRAQVLGRDRDKAAAKVAALAGNGRDFG